MWPILDPRAPTESGGFPEKNMQNSAKNIAPSPFPRQKDETGRFWETLLRGREMGFSWTVITFCRPNGFQIWDVRCDRGKILYKICENQPKIPLLTRFIGYRPKTVKMAGSSPGGQELGPRGPGWYSRLPISNPRVINRTEVEVPYLGDWLGPRFFPFVYQGYY